MTPWISLSLGSPDGSADKGIVSMIFQNYCYDILIVYDSKGNCKKIRTDARAL